MLREGWPILGAIVVIAGLIVGSAIIAVLGFLVLIAGFAASQWARWSLRRVRYERIIPEDHAFAGETARVNLRITNNKPLPLPWIHTLERFPSTMIRDEDGGEFQTAGQVQLMQHEWRTSIGGHQRVGRSFDLHCPERGLYAIGPTRLRSGDIFGLFSRERIEDRRSRIVVYPRTVPLLDQALPARRPHGDIPKGLPIFEDPSRVAGVRDYSPGDSLRRIDWNATARLNRLQSRVYEPSSSQHLLLCVNTQTTETAWSGFVPELLERAITIAASLARDAYDRRYSAGLLANSTFPEADRSIRIAPGRRPEQYIRILEALAIITPYVVEPLAAMLDREEHKLSIGTTVAAITNIMPDELAATLLRLSRRGHDVVVLSTNGETWPELLGDLPVRDLSHIEVTWAEQAI